MATKITIGETPINATYTAVTGTTSGAGTGAKFDVTKTNGVYTTVIQAAFLGAGYAAGDTITIACKPWRSNWCQQRYPYCGHSWCGW